MRCIDDKPNGIVLNHSPDWTGQVRLAWYIADERVDPGPVPPSLRECWCDARDLVAGRFTPTSSPPDKRGSPPPVDVITRAVALAVESYLRASLAVFLDEALFIRRGQL